MNAWLKPPPHPLRQTFQMHPLRMSPSWSLSFSPSSSDIDTRRRAACDLVRGLCKFFEAPVTAIFSGYVNSMLGEYAKNRQENWKHKDAAIYLVTSLASKAQTQKVAVTPKSLLL